MIRHQGQGPGRTPAEADTSPTLPLDGAEAPRDPGTEPTVPLEAAEVAGTRDAAEVPGTRDAAELGDHDAAEIGPRAEPGTASSPRAEPERTRYIGDEREDTDVEEHSGVDLARLAWLGTVGACLIAVAILVVEGYYGYAAVTFAVAASAALNLT
jgi:hypothetical protein